MIKILVSVQFLPVAYYSDHFNQTFDLGRSFLSHIDHDTIDLVSVLKYLIVVYMKYPV